MYSFFAIQHSIAPPPPPSSYYSAEDDVMLENGSGRIRLIGKPLKAARLITGIIIGALGMENPNRDVEVVDICDAGLAPPLLWIRHRISALRSRLELNGSTE